MKITIMLLFLCITLWGCSKDSLVTDPIDKEKPPVVVNQPKMVELTISPTSEVIAFGDSITIAWRSENAEYCVVNGKKVKSSDSFKIAVYQESTVSAKAVRGDLVSSEMNKTIKVGDWQSSPVGLLTYNVGWQLDSSKVFRDGVQIRKDSITAEQKSIKIFFYLDGTEKGYDALGNPAGGSTYSFLDNFTKIKWGSEIYKILELKPKNFTREIPGLYQGKPSLYVDYYGRH